MSDVEEAITRAHHEEWARVVASLTRRFGDLDIAEEAAAEAFATAVERWPAEGVPPNPGAWLTTTANRKAIDRIRRENKACDEDRYRIPLTVNGGCWHALPMGIHATLMLAPGCSPWRPKSEPTTSPDAVTDGDGDGRHAARE